jgi:hypothetical protein
MWPFKNKRDKEIEELKRELRLLQSEIRQLKYLWDLKEITERSNEEKRRHT